MNRTAALRDDNIPSPTAASIGKGFGIEIARRSKPRLFKLDEQPASRNSITLCTDDNAPLPPAASIGNGFKMEMARRSKLRLLIPVEDMAERNTK